MGRWGVLRGSVRVALIHDLALNAETERALAERYGVSQPSIHEFLQRNQLQVAEARSVIEDQFASLWIANKRARLAEYEDDIEAINSELDTADVDAKPRLYAAKHRALRSAAEELGQLAPRAIDATVKVRYEIVGVDMDALS